jgi:transposase
MEITIIPQSKCCHRAKPAAHRLAEKLKSLGHNVLVMPSKLGFAKDGLLIKHCGQDHWIRARNWETYELQEL